jgi:L-iditol 2-dehydrogenase
MTEMMAAVFYGPRDIRIERVARPSPNDDEALIAVRSCGICGTDNHLWEGTFPIDVVPRILGHEFAGEVTDVGANKTGFAAGDHVVADINIGCGQCVYCHRDQKLLCPELTQLGIHRDGGFAEYVVAPVATLRKLPEKMTFPDAALVEPVVCALHGQDQAGIAPGESLAIIGAGPMGLIHAMLGKVRGAAPIAISEVNERRLEHARRIGVEAVIDGNAADAVDQLRAATGGAGADVVVEAVGSEATYRQATKLLRPGGRLLMFGAPAPNVTVPIHPFDMYRNEWKLVGSFAGTYRSWLDAIALIANSRLDTAQLITSEIALEELPGALESLATDPAAIKVQVAFAAGHERNAS